MIKLTSGLRLLSLLSLLIVFFSCQIDNDNNDINVVDEVIVRQNPYSLANMEAAVKSLGLSTKLQPTHLYVRTKSDLVDSGLITFNHPIENLMPEGISEFTGWHYTWFPIDQKVSFDYELICELVLQDEVLQDDKLSKIIDNYDDIEFASKSLTGNLPTNADSGNLSAYAGLKKAKKWNPSGTIRIHDDAVFGTFEPVVGITVRILDWFKAAEVNTDSSGYFRCGHTQFSGNVTYNLRLNLPGNKVMVEDDHEVIVFIHGPNKTGSWIHDITDVRSTQWFYVSVFVGAANAVTYSGTAHKVKMAVVAHNSKSPSSMYGQFIYGRFRAYCEVWRYKNNGERFSFLQLVATSAHEMGHAMHWSMDKKTYIAASFRLQESWAGVRAYDVVNQLKRGRFLNGSNQTEQMLLETNGIHYQLNTVWEGDHSLPIFIDMKDNYNQKDFWWGYLLEDFVRDHNTLTMEKVLFDHKCKTIQAFIDNYDVPDDYLWEYFQQYTGKGL